ncbi:MAG: response regulator [Thiovulaceae bacterium]|nr:response regulator [Sulfurimonadaceae bacterium]
MIELNILIIEDESLVAMELSNTISSFGYYVTDYATGSKMSKTILKKHPRINLIIMDINLNESINGIELYKSLNTDIPIVYITAYKDDEYISKAIETNPVGYLLKPYDEIELKALLKLASYKLANKTVEIKEGTNLLEIGEGYFFDKEEDTLLYKNMPIKLTKKESQLLKLVLFSTDNRVSYETIENSIYDGDVVSNAAIRTLIYRLRCKLEHKFIENEFNYGIKLK